MTQETKIKNDRDIAYFMGWRIDNSFPDKGRVWRLNNCVEMDTTFKFSKDWNVLQEVVEKIEDIGFNFHTHQARVMIVRNDTGLINGLPEINIEVRSSTVDFDKKQATYQAVSNFVEWYNKFQIEQRNVK